MNPGPTLSIRTTVLAAIALAVLLPVVIWWSAQLSLLRELYQPIVAQNRQAVLGLTAEALVEPMWTIDETGTAAAVARALDDPSVRGVRLTEQRPGPRSEAIVHAYGQIGTPELRREVTITREGESLGTLEVWFDSAQLDRLIASHRSAALKLAALQIAVAGLVLLLVLYRRLLAPIARLKAQATQLGQRGPVQAWDWPRPDELGQLGQHLNAVHAQVHELFGRLEQQQIALEQLALHDTLTGLPNRLLFRELLQKAVYQAQREGSTLALLFIDLDRFKSVNDTLGHAAGDALLIEVAQRLGAAVRAADVVCRHSGDEFLLLLPDAGTVDQVAALVERLQQDLARPHGLEGREVEVGASIGIALCPADATDPEALVHHADLAMYEAKRAGRARHSFFRAEFNEQVQSRVQLERELGQALRRGEFVLHYQPLVGANDGALHGCEALIRWQHPQRGLVAPGAFIPTAEACGLIGAIGLWALGEACAQIARWKAGGLAFGRVAVNLSAAEFRQPNLVELVQAAMDRHGVRPDELELEVTETVLMSDGDAALRIIAGLRALGLKIVVDDFGTGYSSLAYLKRLRPRTIKIDRSFLHDLPDDEEDRVVVLAILGLAQALGIEVVAEGVETDAQREFLRGACCDVLQGYLISRPVDAAAFEAWVRQRPAPRA